MKKNSELFLTYIQSAETAQKYLYACYQKNSITNAQKWSYDNCYQFFYYIKHGLLYYQTGKQSPIVTQPLFYFYGMTHLIKACLLAKIPDYPASTSLLAHGLTTRKRKKRDYQFLQDEVKIQQKGLFPYFASNLFQVHHWPSDKVQMDTILKTIPEMNAMFFMHTKQINLVKVASRQDNHFTFPSNLLDTYHLSQGRFLAKLSSFIDTNTIEITSSSIRCRIRQNFSILEKGPFTYHMDEDSIYFPSTSRLPHYSHEIMHHYILLYNLSMIARYETEWWGDVLHGSSTKDYPFIKHFLDITSDKIPLYIGHYLHTLRDENNKVSFNFED
ncbi:MULTISPECIES: YaaC family protein [Paraliobacillus]|uniref:YaaC family protein n=1 Tax=Paraliobacillus TaxID=200903 RepID=UPI001300697B|nr:MULTISPECIES: YaaC family protein [Paraliobacillus]